MIRSIKIDNFQRHKRLFIELDPRLTVIVGPSDSGKSAILRAMKWVMTNRPSGDDFIRHGAPFVRASMLVDVNGNPCKVVRIKTGATNAYSITYRKGPTKMMYAIGQDVPEPVAMLFNVGDVNFQGQHDAAFWFSLTPGDVAKHLNAVVNLGAIDRVYAYLRSLQRDAAMTLRTHKGRLRDLRAKKAALTPYLNLNNRLKGVETAEADRNRLMEESRRIAAAVEGVVQYRQTLRNATQPIVAALPALKTSRRWAHLDGRAGFLEEKVRQAAVLAVIVGREPPDGRRAIWLREKATTLADLLTRGWDLTNTMTRLAKKLEAAEERIRREGGGKCPMCGTDLT